MPTIDPYLKDIFFWEEIWTSSIHHNMSLTFPKKQSAILVDTIVPFSTRSAQMIFADKNYQYNISPIIKNVMHSLGTYSGCMSVRICKKDHVNTVRIEPAFKHAHTGMAPKGFVGAAKEFLLLDALMNSGENKEVSRLLNNLMESSVRFEQRIKLLLSSLFEVPECMTPQVFYVRKVPPRKARKKKHKYFVSSTFVSGEADSYVVELRVL